jgi:hypothetical protein
VELHAHWQSDGSNMRELPDDSELASIGRGRKTVTPVSFPKGQPGWSPLRAFNTFF